MTSHEAAFRPSRPKIRASLGAAASYLRGSWAAEGKENVSVDSQTAQHVRKKRAQSLGGESLKALDDSLSPRKRARRSLVPGRSILKGSLTNTNLNITQPLYTPDETPANTGTFSFTSTFNQKEITTSFAENTDRRKSLARRVSFAQTAHLREFQRDDPDEASNPSSPGSGNAQISFEDDDQEPESHLQEQESHEDRGHQRRSSVTSLDDFMAGSNANDNLIADISGMSMDLVNDESATAGFGAVYRQAADLLADEPEPSFAAEEETSAMDIVDPHAATTAFVKNTVIVNRQFQYSIQPESFDKDSGNISVSTGATEEDSVIAAALGAEAEYEVPLNKEGVHASGSTALEDEGEDEDDDDMSMDVEGQTIAHAPLIISDGQTSRRISHGGSVRRGSVAPGLKALALLDAMDEEDEAADIAEDEDGGGEEEEVNDNKTSFAVAGSNFDKEANGQSDEDNDDATVEMQPFANPSTNVSKRASLAPLVHQATTPERQKSPLKRQRSPLAPKIGAPPSSLAKLVSPAAQRLVEGIPHEADDQSPDVELEPTHGMSLAEFFALTKTSFVPTMTAKKRKSAIGSTNDSVLMTKGKPTLGDQMIAMGCLVHDLEMYHTMSKELRASMHENTAWLEDVDEILEHDAPAVFKRYQDASEQERIHMETQFKIAKSYFRLEIRNEWYAFRTNAIESVCEVFEHHHKGIESDRKAAATAQKEAETVLPELRARHAQLLAELEVEKRREAELSSCDQDHLLGLREAVTEQAAQIESFARDKTDVENQVKRMQARVAELQLREHQAEAAIQVANQTCKRAGHVSLAEVKRNIDDLVAVQDAHGWQLVDFNDTEFKMAYRNALCLILHLNQQGLVDKVEPSLISATPCAGQFQSHTYLHEQRLEAFLFDRLTNGIEVVRPDGEEAASVLWRATAAWKGMRDLIAQISFAGMRYPYETKLLTKKSRANPFLRIILRMFCPGRRLSFTASLELSGDEIFGTESLTDFGCTVESRFGDLDCQEVTYIMRERLSLGGKDCILDACMQAEAHLL